LREQIVLGLEASGHSDHALLAIQQELVLRLDLVVRFLRQGELPLNMGKLEPLFSICEPLLVELFGERFNLNGLLLRRCLLLSLCLRSKALHRCWLVEVHCKRQCRAFLQQTRLPLRLAPLYR